MPEAALPRGYILGFDFGLRRIGVAVGQGMTRTASSLETVSNGRKPDWAAIDRLVEEWRPALLLVGLPLGEDGGETPMSGAARRFGAPPPSQCRRGGGGIVALPPGCRSGTD